MKVSGAYCSVLDLFTFFSAVCLLFSRFVWSLGRIRKLRITSGWSNVPSSASLCSTWISNYQMQSATSRGLFWKNLFTNSSAVCLQKIEKKQTNSWKENKQLTKCKQKQLFVYKTENRYWRWTGVNFVQKSQNLNFAEKCKQTAVVYKTEKVNKQLKCKQTAEM